MPRFVVLRHDPTSAGGKPLHWDLMLECSGFLRTWALGTEPNWDANISAEQLANHRLAYLDYEGPLTQDRGTVTRWDQGTYEVLCDLENELRVQLDGQRLIGELTLRRASAGDPLWTAGFSRRCGS